ncbi:MAG TPA: exodeoxyribonuclease VII large subunit [Candidatus Paceibacterota bacterium]|nr:exodeoxyribonuclease VII large subunit [Candidatus Pacearchaeota archaeon]HRZ51387.1 exodeoxyribonuclease VII large subunit [Candidatus Paceibacterota bacterium]HSA37109.1 exodeoxyribonuclease VII large subunit [Candidatus Paceibacterota bacterium]
MEYSQQFNFGAPQTKKDIYTVSEYVELLNQKIKPLTVKVIGEVSEAKLGPTGHMYFSLKDEKNGFVISGAIWRSRYELYGIKLAVGLKIVASGHAEIYGPSGRLSFIADSIELAGEGALKKEYDRLLKKLAQEGIFDQQKKRPIPKFIRRIGVITSKQGAVIHDFTTNLGKFGFVIEFIDSRVEGQLAVGDLVASIKTFKKRRIDVLVIMRGGGSLEAMMAFNNETIVREIAAFPVPVIAGIGHDKDVPLAAMAADLATSTPSIAATTISQSWEEIGRSLDRYEVFTVGEYKNVLNNAKSKLGRHAQAFGSFKYILNNVRRFLDDSGSRIAAQLKLALMAASQQLEYLEKNMASNDPERQLKIGFSIVKSHGRILKSVAAAAVGEKIDISLADGTINSQIIKIENK